MPLMVEDIHALEKRANKDREVTVDQYTLRELCSAARSRLSILEHIRIAGEDAFTAGFDSGQRNAYIVLKAVVHAAGGTVIVEPSTLEDVHQIGLSMENRPEGQRIFKARRV